jgi:hypothetical protein
MIVRFSPQFDIYCFPITTGSFIENMVHSIMNPVFSINLPIFIMELENHDRNQGPKWQSRFLIVGFLAFLKSFLE